MYQSSVTIPSTSPDINREPETSSLLSARVNTSEIHQDSHIHSSPVALMAPEVAASLIDLPT